MGLCFPVKPFIFLSILGSCQNVVCGPNADRCVNGVCMCGGSAACSGKSDTCTNNKCRCGVNPPCDGSSSVCTLNMCRCVNIAPCNIGFPAMPLCLEPDGSKPTTISTTAACQVIQNILYKTQCLINLYYKLHRY